MLKFNLILFSLLFIFQMGRTQDATLSKEYKTQTIEKLAQLIVDFYVSEDVGKLTKEHLITQMKDGHFDAFKNDEDFATALTESVQSINHDKHMRIVKNRPYVAPVNTPERVIEERLDQMNQTRSYNGGFYMVKTLQGNVSYLDLRGFAGIETGKPVADACMKLMLKADAIIIDVSKNGGGSPDMVQYLCSYFFDEKLHLNSLYYREGNRTQEYWTLDKVGGAKMPDIPLFVITGERTFSGAEEFSYNMQTQKRATLVGQTTGGGANPGGTRGINENLSVFIPTGMAINPITKTSWEGIGVIPEVVTTVDETFDKAHDLAREAAKEYRAKKAKSYSELYKNLQYHFDHYAEGKSDGAILESLKECVANELLYEWNINLLGYDYLMEHQKPEIAEAIFKANTILFPNSSNAFDSYAEALMARDKKSEAIKNYQKSVGMNPENENGFMMLEKLGVDMKKPDPESLYFLTADASWRKEIFPFPINFAPDIPYEGVEDARFPEGWEQKESPNFWTYAFAWNIHSEEDINAIQLEENLQIYFDGLMEGVNKNQDFMVPQTVAQLIQKDDGQFLGKIKLYDSFHTEKVFSLNVLVEIKECVQQNKTFLLFKFSPQPFGEKAWEKLKEVGLPENGCEIR